VQQERGQGVEGEERKEHREIEGEEKDDSKTRRV
jgi:hypothetical protein